MIAKPSNIWNGCFNMMLTIQVIRISKIKISMVTRNAINSLCFREMAAMKYVTIMIAAIIIIKMSNIFMLSPHSNVFIKL